MMSMDGALAETRQALITLESEGGLRPVPPLLAQPAQPFGLTPRELEVLRLVSLGMSDREIGDQLFKEGAVISGCVPTVTDNVLVIEPGTIYVDGHLENVPGATLTYAPEKNSGADYVYLELLKYNIGYTMDAALVNPATGEPTAEREQWVLSFKAEDTSSFALPNNVTERKVVTIYKGHDLAWDRDAPVDLAPLGVPAYAFTVCCVANWGPRKGVEVLIRAFALLPS